MKIAGLSNGVHIFSEEKGSTNLGDCLKENVTNESCVAIMTVMEINEIDKIRFYKDGKAYQFSLSKVE